MNRAVTLQQSLRWRIGFYLTLILITVGFIGIVIIVERYAMGVSEIRWEYVPVSVRHWAVITETSIPVPIITSAWVFAAVGFFPGLNRSLATIAFSLSAAIVVAFVVLYAVAIQQVIAFGAIPTGPHSWIAYEGGTWLGSVIQSSIMGTMAGIPFWYLLALLVFRRRKLSGR